MAMDLIIYQRKVVSKKYVYSGLTNFDMFNYESLQYPLTPFILRARNQEHIRATTFFPPKDPCLVAPNWGPLVILAVTKTNKIKCV